MATTFRLAGAADLEPLLDMLGEMQEFFAFSHHPWDRDRARPVAARLLEDPNLGAAWLIEDEGALAGYVVLVLGYSLEFGGRDAFVDELFLRAPFRGRGLGWIALEHVEREARARDVQALHLEVERGNDPALGLYRKFGFVDHDRYMMTKRLSS